MQDGTVLPQPSHGTVLPQPSHVFNDDARRISDAMNMHALAGSKGKWVAFALADGTSPDRNTVYDTREDAVRHRRWNRDNYVYLQIAPDGMPTSLAGEFLRYARMLHDNGYRMPDPREFNAVDNIPAHDSMPLLETDKRAQIRELCKVQNLKNRTQ